MPETAAMLICAYCKEKFSRPKPSGRPPTYCSKDCRSAAYRNRHRSAPQRSDYHDQEVVRIAEALRTKANRALHLSRHPYVVRPLDLVKEVVRLEREVADLKAVAVRQAHEYGAGWEDIGKALSMAPGHARDSFASDKVAKIVDWRASRGSGPRTRDDGPTRTSSHTRIRNVTLPTPTNASLPGHPGYQLAVALTHLHRTSALSGRGLAVELGISPSLLSRIMLGKRTPKWPVVQRFAELCQANPDDLLPLWEKAQGIRASPPPRLEDHAKTARALQNGLRGMWLAAAAPEPGSLCRGSSSFTPAQITAALESTEPAAHLADWQFVARLALALRGSPEDLRALWLHMHAVRPTTPNPINDKDEPRTPNAKRSQFEAPDSTHPACPAGCSTATTALPQ
ncbi:helix-turn-helix transcriptional regulator [Streptomyces sp. NPDC051577]|uniref:helix-turn-helix domain-containing protein n=1 Tax=Streptomyces sp. NPDC051577 TaxID=3155166 RepID=UPI00343E71B9